jgi:hypothetical protein
MPATALTVTTLTNAIAVNQRTLAVASNSSHTVGEYIVIGGSEACLVQSKASTTLITVERGQLGTKARAHVALARVYGSSLSAFGPTQYEPHSGEQRVTLSDAPGKADLPTYVMPLGATKRDGFGNEFILVDVDNETVYTGTPVAITTDFKAARIGTTGRGYVGVAAEKGTSDQWIWVQIRGRCVVQLLGNTAGVSPSDDANGPTTLSTTAQTKFWTPTTATSTGPEGVRWTSGNVSTTSGFYIEGMTVATDASPSNDVSTVSTATSHTGSQVSVVLNYPRLVHVNVGE